MITKKRQDQPKIERKPPQPTRFCTRVETAEGIKELGISADLKKEIARAISHHSKHGLKTWVWNLRTGVTVHRLERVAEIGGAR